MNGKTSVPIKSLKAEHAKLTTERNRLDERYIALKTEVKEAEQIRRSVHGIIRAEQQQPQTRRVQNADRSATH